MKTPLTSCLALRDDLKAYLDGELSPLRRAELQFHLRHCPDCRAEVETMTQISHDLQASESATPGAPVLSPQLRERILDNLPEAPQTAPSTRPTKRGIPPLVWNYGIAACLIGLVCVGANSLTHQSAPQTFSAASNQLDSGGSDDSRPLLSGAITSEDQARILEKRFNANAQSSTENGFNKERRIAGLPSTSQPGRQIPSKDTSALPAALRRVHKEARLTVAVNDIEAQSAAAEQSVRAAGGYIVSNDLSTGADNRKSAQLDLRVPVTRFENIVSELAGLGEVRAKQVTGQDMTEQFSDSEQAKNVLTNELNTREAQLKAALDKIAKTKKKDAAPADPWELRAEVRRLRVEAAQARARLELMRKLSDLSVITLELKEKSLTPTGGFSQEMGETVRGAGDTFLVAARLPIKLFIWIFAFSPLWLPLLLAYRVLTRRLTPQNTHRPLP